MTARDRVPPLLDPYIRLPPETSLILLTGVLDATPHWITTRFLSRCCGRRGDGRRQDTDDPIEGIEEDVAVVLVSWMRSYDFWKADARRGAGIDLARLAAAKRFAFVDGLSSLFPQPSTGGQAVSAQPRVSPSRASPAITGGQRLIPPQRGSASPRTPAANRPQATRETSQVSTTTPAPPSPAQGTTQTQLTNPDLAPTLATITHSITSLLPRRIFLILDAPTLPLATVPSITAHDLSLFTLQLRSQVHSTLVVTEADTALISAAAPDAFDGGGGGGGGGGRGKDYLATRTRVRDDERTARISPLERDHAAFVVGQAHAARWVIGTRGLGTGVARDVSGVVEVRRGGSWYGDHGNGDGDDGAGGDEARELEALYKVGVDGSVNVFERGAGDIG